MLPQTREGSSVIVGLVRFASLFCCVASSSFVTVSVVRHDTQSLHSRALHASAVRPSTTRPLRGRSLDLGGSLFCLVFSCVLFAYHAPGGTVLICFCDRRRSQHAMYLPDFTRTHDDPKEAPTTSYGLREPASSDRCWRLPPPREEKRSNTHDNGASVVS